MHNFLDAAKTAIENVLSEQFISKESVLESLKEILDFVSIRIEALESEIRQDKK